MPVPPRLRLITTNDLFGSFFTRPTSYGAQPGARSLVNTVDRLRNEAVGSVWVDDGDFAQGGPLAPASGGTYGFTTFGQLGVDVATVGNHEFDWGEKHLRRWVGESDVPVVVANYDIGAMPSTIVDAAGVAVGVIGLTHPALHQFNATLRRDQPATTDIVPELARTLRRDGAEVVVVSIHDGVDWTTTPAGPLAVDTTRIAQLCAALRPHIDVLIGGHTLGRFVGELEGLPFVQPWAFGAEVGVLDMNQQGLWSTQGVMLRADEPWQGAGAAANAALSAEIVGHTATPLVVKPHHDNSLAQAMARGIGARTGADVSIVFNQQLQTMQAPIDGTFAYLPAGPVSEADVLRAVPFVTEHVNQDVFVSEMSPQELELLLACASGQRKTDVDVALSPRTWGAPAVVRNSSARTGDAGSTISVAMASLYSERALAEEWIGRELSWQPSGIGLRDALRTDLAR